MGRMRDFYAHPVGRDVIDKFFNLQGRSNRWIDNPIVGRLRLKTLDRVVRLLNGHALIPLLINLANSEPHAPEPGEGEPEPTWWKQAVFYQVYPRSFADSDGDGLGDLGGLLERLDHLVDLGVDCLWLGPIYDSPNEDGGYDVRDYRAVMEQMGTLEQVDALIAACHARGMRIILDLVVNHTSDQHAWFQQALTDPDGPYGAYYFLIPPDPEHPEQPPNNWQSTFTGPAWRWLPEIQRWVLHLFAPGQPDLNWENPRVRDEVVDICLWWFERGIDGFRMDVINFISKPPDLPDGHELIGDLLQVAGVEHYFYGPRLHEYLRELRSRAFEVPGSQPRVMVGETPGIGVETGRLLTGADRGELDLIFSFDHLESGSHSRFDEYRYDLEWYKRYLIDYQSRLGSKDWLTLFFENHDNPRMISKVNPDPEHRVALGKLLGTLLLTMRGTPFLYQGQELAAVNQPFAGITDLQDVEAHRRFGTLVQDGATEEDAWTQVLTSTRDHARVPLRWDASPGGGFTTGTPWLAGGPEPGFSAAEQAVDPGSVLNHYRRLTALRSRHRALRMGDVEFIEPERTGLFSWFRTSGPDRLCVQLNLTDQPLPIPEPDPRAELLLGSHTGPAAGMLAPYESRVYRWPEPEASPELDLPRRRLRLGDWTVDVRRTGPSHGTPVVLVHGIGMSGDYFLPFARVLARDHPVFLLDLPGYGPTPRPPRPLSVSQLARAAALALDELGVQDPILVGQSMGCQVVATMVAAAPEQVAGYILIGPTVDPAAHGPVRLGLRLVRDMMRETLANNAVVLRDYARMGPVRYLRTARHMFDDRIEDTIARCTVSGLVVRGSRDPIAPSAWTGQLARSAPDAVTAEVAGAAHNAQHTHPEELAAACRPFLSRVATS